MNDFVSTTRPIIELLYLLSGIVLVFVALYGTQQIKLLKADIQIRNERAAKEKALENANRFLEEYIPAFNKYYEALVAAKLSIYNGPIQTFNFKEEFENGPALDKLIERMKIKEWVAALNQLEGIAASFVTGVADERTGFDIFGLAYVSSVSSCYDVICACQLSKFSAGETTYYRNTIKLFHVWHSRLTAKQVEIAREKLTQQLFDIGKPYIPIIGT
jgi:hypothetical protein